MTLQGCGGYCSSLDGKSKDLCLKCVEKVEDSPLDDEYKTKLKKKCEEGSEQVQKVEDKIKEKSKSAAALQVHARANFLGVDEPMNMEASGNGTEKNSQVHDLQFYISGTD